MYLQNQNNLQQKKDEAFKKELMANQLKIIRKFVIYLFISWQATLTLYTIRKREKNFNYFLRVGFQSVIFLFLLLSCWKLNAIKPLAYIILIRIYYWIFLINRIFDTDIDKLPVLFFQFVISILLLVVHVIFIGKILLKNRTRASAVFYIANGNLLFFGLV